MILFSLLLIFYLPSFIFDSCAKCDEQFYTNKQNYSVCRFIRDGEDCDFKKFDSNGDEPCMIGRKAGLTRINGVKVGHVEEVDLGDGTRKRITRAMRPPVFEIPNFLSDEECDHMIHLAVETGLFSSIARGGLQSPEEFKIPTIRNGKSDGMVGYFEGLDLDGNEKVTLEEVMAFGKKYHFLILTKEETLELLHNANITEFDDGFATRDEFDGMNSLGLNDMFYATALSHPLHRARLSEQTWVNQRGLGDPVLDKIIERGNVWRCTDVYSSVNARVKVRCPTLQIARVRRLQPQEHFRVVELTRLPREIIYGSERLQVVVYGENGHYHAHFDSETHKRTDVRCCHLQENIMEALKRGQRCRICRYMTILYYLNDVEQGGETAFPIADNATLDMKHLTTSRGDFDYYNLSHNCHKGNLVLSPRKGTAIMWYNHLLDEESGWLGPMDDYSLHGGCDILKGEKWIANNWITAPYKDSAHIPSQWLSKFDI